MLLCKIEKALTKQIELSETAFVYFNKGKLELLVGSFKIPLPPFFTILG
jgi:hypothetical protein